MKLLTDHTVFGSDWTFSADHRAGTLLKLCFRDTPLLEICGSNINGFAETDAINTKFRFHSTVDHSAADLEMESRIPFGGEAVVRRTIDFHHHWLNCCVDCRPGVGEVIRNLDLDDLCFPGEWESLEIVPWGGEVRSVALDSCGEGEKTIFQDANPPLALRFFARNGVALELRTGDDLWRWQGGNADLGSPEFRLYQDASGVLRLRRKVLQFAQDAELQRRPWRMTYLIAFSAVQPQLRSENELQVWSPEQVASLVPSALRVQMDGQKVLPECPCSLSPAWRKSFRYAVRTAPQAVAVQLPLLLPGVCYNAGHLERPGKASLAHGDCTALLDAFDWGNRTLKKQGGSLRFESPEMSASDALVAFARTPVGQILTGMWQGDIVVEKPAKA